MSVLDLVMEQLDGATVQRMSQQIGASPQQTRSAIGAALPVLLGAMQRNSSTGAGAQALHRAVTRDHLNVDVGGLLGGILGGGGGAGGLGDLLGGVLGGGGAPAPAPTSGGGLGDLLGGVLGGGRAPAPAPASGGGLGDLLGGVLGAMGGGSPAPAPAPAGGLGMGEAILRHVLGGNQQRAAGGISRASGLDMGAILKLLPMLAPLIMAALGRMTQQRQLDAGGLHGLLGGEMQRVGGGDPNSRGFLGGLLDADGDGDVDAADLLARGSQLFGGLGR